MPTYLESDCHYKVPGRKSKFKSMTKATKSARRAKAGVVTKVCSRNGQSRITAHEVGPNGGGRSTSPKRRRKAVKRKGKGRCMKWSRGRTRCMKRAK